MNTNSARKRHLSRAIAVAAVILTGFAGGQAVSADDNSEGEPVGSFCEGGSGVAVYYELPYEQARPVVVDCADARALEAVHAAAQEAHGWPDFDSTSLGDKARAADAEPLPDIALTANGRSIPLTEFAGFPHRPF